MRTIITTASLILFSLSSYATFTIDPSATYTDFNGGISTTTTKVSGTCTVSDFSNPWSASKWLVDANITIEGAGKRISATATNKAQGGLSVSGGSGWYSVVCQGTNTLTLADGGHVIFNALSVYDSDKTSSLTLTVNDSAGDEMKIEKLFINNGSMLTANLYKENALSVGNTVDSTVGSACIGKHFELNMNCNQQLKLDFRDGTENAFNITNGAILTVSGWGYIDTKKNTASSFIFADGLKNGAIIFSDTSALWDFESWDDSKAVFTVTNATGQEMAVSFVDDKGNKLDGLSFSKVEGGYLFTGMTSVPEPAEWAVILGSLALGLALYQRRK